MTLTIGHIEGLSLGDEAIKRFQNELNSLSYLADGLRFLATQVSRVEGEVRGRLPDDKLSWGVGNVPWLEGVPMGLVACSFHWYAVSACNYARLVGWLGLEQDPKKAGKYVRGTLPQVLDWRNKVAAHFALTVPRGDSPADLVSSTMFPVGFEDDSLVARPLTYAQTGSTTTPMKWSLTHVHSELRGRYWPIIHK